MSINDFVYLKMQFFYLEYYTKKNDKLELFNKIN